MNVSYWSWSWWDGFCVGAGFVAGGWLTSWFLRKHGI